LRALSGAWREQGLRSLEAVHAARREPARGVRVTRTPDMPPGWELWRADRDILACRKDCKAALAALGWTPSSRLELPASALAGRAPLGELGPDLLVRRLRHGGLLRFATGERYLDPDRPFREARLSARLADAGVPTAEVVAARAQRLALLGWRLELVVRRVADAQDLGRIMESARAAGARLPPGLLRATGALARRLHDLGFEHADLQPNNLLVRGAPAAGALLVLDLDGSRFHASMDEHSRARNLARLTRADWLRALAGYEPRLAERRRMALRLRSLARRSWWWHRIGWRFETLRGERRR
jgi:tRNA A-37 threonylcarbamoyl transferase component Bud32